MRQRPVILVVDDALENIALAGAALQPDCDVRFATSGSQALELAASSAPELILLDVTMPGMDGYEVCRRLKADLATRHIPVLFLTRLDEEEEHAKGLALGAADFLQKPLRKALLRARVMTHVDLKRKTEALQRLGASVEE